MESKKESAKGGEQQQLKVIIRVPTKRELNNKALLATFTESVNIRIDAFSKKGPTFVSKKTTTKK